MKKTLLVAVLLTSVFAQAGFRPDGTFVSGEERQELEHAANEARSRQVRLNSENELVDGNDSLILKTQPEAFQACRSLGKKLPTLREAILMRGQTLLSFDEYMRNMRESGSYFDSYYGSVSVLNPSRSGGVEDSVYYTLTSSRPVEVFMFNDSSGSHWTSSTSLDSSYGISFTNRDHQVAMETKLKVKCK